MSAVGRPDLAAPEAHPLDLLLRARWPAAIVEGDGPKRDGSAVVCRTAGGEPVWLRADDWHVLARPGREAELGEIVKTFVLDDGSALHARVDSASGDVVVPFSLADAYTAYLSEAWRSESSQRRLSERQLAVFYRVRSLVPRRLQLAARRRLIKAQGVPEFPAWPVDTSVSELLRFYAFCALRAAGREEGDFVWFWPDGHRAAITLTHDVEGIEGIRLALQLADVEEGLGFRSSFNFGAWYDIDPGVLRELDERGFEIGMHGLTHDRELFSSRAAFEARLPRLGALAERLGAVGFRSPATHRVFDWLAELPVEYDCTIPNSDPYEPQPGGCCSVWPFFIGPVVELPYTLAQDHTMLTLLRHRSAEPWLQQAATVEREHGLIQCVSHPDPGYLGDADKRAVYEAFLAGISEREHIWRALPRDVSRWWRSRASDVSTDDRLICGRARISDGASVSFEPPLV